MFGLSDDITAVLKWLNNNRLQHSVCEKDAKRHLRNFVTCFVYFQRIIFLIHNKTNFINLKCDIFILAIYQLLIVLLMWCNGYIPTFLKGALQLCLHELLQLSCPVERYYFNRKFSIEVALLNCFTLVAKAYQIKY